jgi:hypothetical protein
MQARGFLLLALAAAACGGDATSPPPPPPPPAPVARVAVTPASVDLVPAETEQLTAVTLDAADQPLTGRPVTWESSAGTVATVSASGLVTAVGPGSADIIATSEGKSSSARITVREGGYVEGTGGTITSKDSKVRMVVPAGAVPGGTAITITATDTPPPPADATHPVKGTTYVFGPEGTRFGTPVTVTISYDPANLPAWVVPGDLVLRRWDGTAWSTLSDLEVDPVAKTVTGTTPGFSTVGVYFLNPEVTLSPAPGKVNAVQRSVTLTAEVFGEGRNPDALQIEWTHTGTNGTLDTPQGPTVQYTAVTPILPPGDLDGVSVVVKGQFEPDGPFEVIGHAQTTIRADLDLVLQLQPLRALVQYGGSVQFSAQVVDRQGGNVSYSGSQYLRYTWAGTDGFGAFTPLGEKTSHSSVTYTARPPSQQSSVRPKGDKVTLKVTLIQEVKTPIGLGGGFTTSLHETDMGTVEAFVQVIPQYQVTLEPAGVTLDAGKSAAFQVKFEPAWQEDEQLSYRWRRTGNQGNINVPQGVEVTQGSVTYTANSNPPGGIDLIDVDVLVGTIGTLASAQASVSVNARTSLVQGELFATDPIAADAGRSCAWVYIKFPLVEGATRYDMHAYRFDDPAHWGTSIKEFFVTPLPVLPGFAALQSGTMGGDFYFFLTGGCGPNAGMGKFIEDM